MERAAATLLAGLAIGFGCGWLAFGGRRTEVAERVVRAPAPEPPPPADTAATDAIHAAASLHEPHESGDRNAPRQAPSALRKRGGADAQRDLVAIMGDVSVRFRDILGHQFHR